MAISVPAVGDKTTATYADAVANTLNAPVLLDTGLVGASATMPTASAVASLASGSFTLAVQTKVRMEIWAQFQMVSGTNGRYSARASYNSGSSVVIGSAIGAGFFGVAFVTVTGTNGMTVAYGAGTVLLAAGTYTVYGSLVRSSGGGTTDFSQSSQVIATAVGFL